MKYASIDVETTGLDPTRNQLLEVGAVAEDTMLNAPIDQLSKFRAVLIERTEAYNINTYCMRLHSKLFDEIDKVDRAELTEKGFIYVDDTVYCHHEKLEEQFANWCERNRLFTDKGKIIAAGKNFFGFDHRFLKRWLPNIRFHHRCLDPVMYYLRPDDRQPPNLELCCERAGIKMSGYHTAVGDAQMVIELIRHGCKRKC